MAVESWFFILENMSKFVGKPEDMGSRYAPVAEAARMNILPTGDRFKYFYNMVTDEERLDIGAAYYEDGVKAGIIKTAKAMLAKGYHVNDISDCTGLTTKEIEALRKN